jgi:hypothetical protein
MAIIGKPPDQERTDHRFIVDDQNARCHQGLSAGTTLNWIVGVSDNVPHLYTRRRGGGYQVARSGTEMVLQSGVRARFTHIMEGGLGYCEVC